MLVILYVACSSCFSFYFSDAGSDDFPYLFSIFFCIK
jgi:hypothetical protein